MRILAIVNLYAGKGKAREILPVLQRKLKNGNELKIYLTKDKEHTIKLVYDNCNKFDMLVAVGGDGTLNEVINGYMEANCKRPLGYIPAGSTNDFASTLKLKLDAEEACDSFLKMQTRKIDIGKFNGKYFTYVSAAGAFTAASYQTPTKMKNQLGHFAYILSGLASLPTIKPLHMRITVDGNVYEDEYLLAMISNSTSVGGIFSYEEDLVSLNDGKFEIGLVKEPDSPIELGSLLKDVLVHNYNRDYLLFCSGSKIRIESPKAIAWTLDGEYGGEYEETLIENIHEGLNLLQ